MPSRQYSVLALLESTYDAVVVRDPRDKIIFWNRGAERTYGYTEEEAVSEVAHVLLKTRFPVPLVELNSQLTATGNWDGELIQVCKNGQEIRVDSRWTMRREASGTVAEILEINRRVSDSRRTEYNGLLKPDGTLLEANRPSLAFAGSRRDEVVGRQFWETVWFRYAPVILASLPVGVMITDAQGLPLMVNQALKDIWRGASEQHEARSVALGEFFKPEDWPVSRALTTGESQVEPAMTFRRLDGTRGILRVAAVPIKDEHGVVVGGVAVGQDVTDLRRAEEERARLLASEQKLRVEAEEANRLKDEFLALTSHELRTPLNAIVGWTTILRSAAEVNEQLLAKGLEVIQRNAVLQSRIIEELLDVSRIVAGKIVLDNQLLEMSSLIDDAVNSVRPVADAKFIAIFTDVQPGVGRVIGDANRLQQVVCNLLANSVKFTPDGGHIMVTASRVGPEIELAVRDSGSGIEPEFLPHVFEPFRQEGTKTSSEGGLGLGLSIVRHLVELHGGSVTADSEGIGLGAVFTIRFPAADAL